jgi:hypothetical protein
VRRVSERRKHEPVPICSEKPEERDLDIRIAANRVGCIKSGIAFLVMMFWSKMKMTKDRLTGAVALVCWCCGLGLLGVGIDYL